VTNVASEYNLLNDCKYIRNKDRCVRDTNCGFSANFAYGDWGFSDVTGLDYHRLDGKFVWATTTADSCSISLHDDLAYPFEADYFHDLELDMLIRYNTSVVGQTLPDALTGSIAWRMQTDVLYRDGAYVNFEVYPDGVWHHYKINLLENPWWVGNCIDITLFPFTDGAPGVEVIIQRLAFTSDVHYKCNYPPCAYNRHYQHPCTAIGSYAKVTSQVRKRTVEINDAQCRLGVSIDGYPITYIDLDLSHCTDCYSVAQEITLKLNNLSFGGYKFAECRYDNIDEAFSVYTGTKGRGGSISIHPGNIKDVTQELGFFDGLGRVMWKFESGTDPADGYITAYQRLPATILYRLPSSDTPLIDFNPETPAIQIGRSDIIALPIEQIIDEGNVGGTLFIDIFGRANDAGTINKIQYKGKITAHSKVYLLRQATEWSFSVITSVDIKSNNLKAGQKSLYEVTVNWELRPGDVFGLYMCLPSLHTEESSVEKLEMLYKNSWIELRNYNIKTGDTLSFTTDDIKFYGYQGLPVYGFSTTKAPGFGIETELRYEYGVKEVAVIGVSSADTFNFDLAQLETSQFRVSTNLAQGSLQTLKDGDLAIEFSEEEAPDITKFWIDFWFPGYIHGIYRIITTFEDSNNLRNFCWEGYLDPEGRTGLSWSGEYGFYTLAPYLGSEAGWIRLLDPVSVFIDNNLDKTGNLYLGSNYVTYDPWDFYPGIDDTIRYNRMEAGYSIFWNKLDQVWEPVATRGLRLYVWDWANARITSIQILSYFSTQESMLRAIDGVGFSGPQVFDTESYNIVDTYGEVWVSNRISRATTTEYTLGMNFEIRDEDYTTAIAVVGTTLSKFSLDIGIYPTKIKQIKLIPQHLAQQLRVRGDEPVTEIANLSWGSPTTDVEFTYGPSQQYKVTNDTGHKANLFVGVADPLAIDQACVFSSNLKTLESLDDPYRGSKAYLMTSPDTPITNHRCINYHAKAYSILPTEPVEWYSSTTSGEVWQVVVSGNPFTDPLKWSEPTDPNNGSWKIFNWSRTDSLVVSGGCLSIAQTSMLASLSEGYWVHPTYFQETNKDSSFILETQVLPLEGIYEVDVSAGLVIFDNSDLTKFGRIERFTGNSLSSDVDFIIGSSVRWDIPLGDYIRYGDHTQYYTTSGSLPVTSIVASPDYSVLLRINKDKTWINMSWRLPWTSWTTVSAFSIEDWSDEVRVGVFGAAEAVTNGGAGKLASAQVDYVSYKMSANRIVEDFTSDYDFSSLSTTEGYWTSVNTHQASVLSSSSDGVKISNWRGFGKFFFFDSDLYTPALKTEWGAISDIGNIIFRIVGYDELLLGSGIFSAGFLLRDPTNISNHIKFVLKTPSILDLSVNDVSYPVSLDTPIDTSSGIWFQIYKGTGVVIPHYSYDGLNYTIVSGISIDDWTNNVALEACLSSDMDSVTFDNIQVGNSQLDATDLAVKFDPPVPLLNIYGRGTAWYNIEYTTASGLVDFTTNKPDEVTHLRFRKDQDQEVEVDSVKFIASPQLSRQVGYELSSMEIHRANQQLYDFGGNIQTSDPVITESGAGWSTNSSLGYKGIAQADSPVVALDFGKPYHLGRCRLGVVNVSGTFSSSDTPYLTKVDWEKNSYSEAGFNRKCLLSSNNECTANPMGDKPKMVYLNSDVPAYYFAGACDGWTTKAGTVNKACPLYTGGQARWLLLESQDYISTTVSSANMWFLGPVEAAPASRPIPITNDWNWWSTDFGLIQWIDSDADPGYAIIYSYPGFSTPGTCYFNGLGNTYWRFSLDPYWTWDDTFSIDMKVNNPHNINAIQVHLGRDPNCYYEFTITGSLSRSWQTFQWKYKEVPMVVRGQGDITEPAFTNNDAEYYMVGDMPYLPLPFFNWGYANITVSGVGGSDIYFRNLKNVRERFDGNSLFLGLEEALYIPDIDLLNTGTIKLTYQPSPAAINLQDGDPRDFIYTVLTVGNANAGLCVALDLQWGWTLYCFSPKEQLVYTSFPPFSEAQRIIPTATNTGPFELVLSWAPGNIPGLLESVVLWVNGIKACYGNFDSMGDFFTTDDVRVTLGKGTTVLSKDDVHPHAAYAKFSDLQIYKRAISVPSIDLDSSTLIPENLLEMSTDGIEWHSFTSGDLPLLFPGVLSGDSCIFYMRNRRPQANIKKMYKRDTAYLMVKWEVSQ
jgi:hypothetical protein